MLRLDRSAVRRIRQATCETLESRLLLTTFAVTNTSDAGRGSLFAAITHANANPGLDRIRFDIPGSGVQTIVQTRNFPAITDPVNIDATTQPGYSGSPLIQIDFDAKQFGFSISAGASTVKGLHLFNSRTTVITLSGSGGNTVESNVIDQTHGILVQSSDNAIGGSRSGQGNVIQDGIGGLWISGNDNQVMGNFFGIDRTGQNDGMMSNYGVYIYSGATGNIIGGSVKGAGNVITRCRLAGIFSQGSQDLIEGNFIGTDPAGDANLGNGPGTGTRGGIYLEGDHDTVGGVTSLDRNIISGNVSAGIVLYGNDMLVEGNYIGTDPTGENALPNGGGIVTAFSGSSRETIGGALPSERNVISGNLGDGIHISAGGQWLIEGNYIGVDATGQNALGNTGNGLFDQGSGNTIGGSSAHAGNVISANGQDGIALITQGTVGNDQIVGNRIGVAAIGNIDVGNAGFGVELVANGSLLVQNDTIGGPGNQSNVIAFNHKAGVGIANGNVGNNPIRFNSIFANHALGIDLKEDGVTLNSNLSNRNYPVLTGISGTTISGTMTGTPNSTLQLDFYFDAAADPSGFGQGQTYLRSRTLTLNSKGLAHFHYDLGTLPAAGFISATATNPNGDTSEFSADLATNATSAAIKAAPPVGSLDLRTMIPADPVKTLFDDSDSD